MALSVLVLYYFMLIELLVTWFIVNKHASVLLHLHCKMIHILLEVLIGVPKPYRMCCAACKAAANNSYNILMIVL
jgi:hypothetical protein